MMTIYEEAVKLTNRLTRAEKLLFLEHLSAALRQDSETEAYRHMPWEQFLNLTYGSFADNSVERSQPLHADIRESVAQNRSA